jgi:hypothetical protein
MEDIGSDHPSDSTFISLAGTNTFHAKPHNDTPNPVNGIKARFRIANWGTNPTSEDVPNPVSTLWKDIADPNGVPQPNGVSITANTVGNITTPYVVSATCDKCMYTVFYNANKSTCDSTCGANAPPTNNTRASHQCLLVDLTGAGVTFIHASAYQNMSYSTTSTFSQLAEINIKDLPGFAGGRDVYLYLQALNMPAQTSPGTQGVGQVPVPGWPPRTDATTTVGVPAPRADIAAVAVEPFATVRTKTGQVITGLSMAVAQGQIDYGQLAVSMPTLIVRAYYDTGVKNTVGGGSRPILRPLTSFGYFVVHDGEVGGWSYDLQGAQRLAPNWYRVAVPASGIATVTTVIESLPPARPVPWLLLLLFLVVLLLILVAYLWRRVHP